MDTAMRRPILHTLRPRRDAAALVTSPLRPRRGSDERRRLLRLACLALLAAAWSSAPFVERASAQLRGEGGLSFIIGVPQGDFGYVVDRPGFGLSLQGGVSSRRSPFVVGGELSFLIYGYERRREPFSYSIPDVGVDVVTSNNIMLTHMMFRVRPPVGPIRPYAEALFGLKYFFTTTDVRDRYYHDDHTIASSTNFDDATLSYGFGAGVDVRMGRRRRSAGLSFHAGIRYLMGGRAEYLVEGGVYRGPGYAEYEIWESDTNILITEFGVSIGF